MKRLFNAIPAWIALLAMLSCTTARQMSYLMDMEYDTDYPAPPAPELVVQPGDCLGITVTSSTPELAAPFNLFSEGGLKYVVDRKGSIEFPVLGTINVWGATLAQIRNGIADGIRANGFIKDPIVTVTLENFSITVIGNAGNAVIPVTGSSIDILQVLAASGNITNRCDIRDIMVIRTENGVRRSYSVDLQSKELFNSPVFYLKQNDVVYVKPKGTSLSASGQTVMTFVNTGLSLIAIIVNTLLWTSR
ncbi:MAG: polysaccharide biosynthesis/export family protein [Bacteroidales bacterium]|nr:polysaccharide biosynthesis/export family protein [Bacteroidales bacterium]